MTSPLTYKRPTEEVAAAISASKAWPAVFEPGASAEASRAAIQRLRDLGFINDIGLVALKAEQEAGKK